MKSLLSFKLLLVGFYLSNLCARQSLANHQPVVIVESIEEKLDKILVSLDVLATKQDQIELKLSQQQQQCPPSSSVTSSGLPQNPVSEPESSNDKDLFHFNKLAANSIPSSSSPWNQADESSPADWLNRETSQVTGDNQMLGDQLESTFKEAFGNLTYLVREQLSAFRTTLAKLLNRQIDHSYQYNSILNQLSSLKEECSLAAAQLPTSQVSKVSDEGTSQQQVAASCPSIRSSDMAAIVRLLSQELNQLAQRETGDDNQVNEQVKHLDNQVELVNKTLVRKLEEIDSVVKQTVLLIMRLSSQIKQVAAGHQTDSVILTYTNTNATSGTLPGNGTQRASRWFAGSKVPGKIRDESQSVEKEQRPPRRCQSKTSLVRPISCQQLRLAGANCTGQYYVFVRGSIRHVYCDMNMDSDDEGGGWTVVLRRIDKSRGLPSEPTLTRRSNHLLEAFKAAQVNFELNWANYKSGFGHLDDWGEFFIGLEPLHQLTNESSQVEMQVDIETIDGIEHHLRFDRFQVDNEDSQYRLELSACNTTQRLCGPLLASNGSSFYTSDKPVTSNCIPGGLSSKAGWWWPSGECPTEQKPFALTAPLGRQANGSVAVINWSDESIQVRRVVMKIRSKRQKLIAAQM